MSRERGGWPPVPSPDRLERLRHADRRTRSPIDHPPSPGALRPRLIRASVQRRSPARRWQRCAETRGSVRFAARIGAGTLCCHGARVSHRSSHKQIASSSASSRRASSRCVVPFLARARHTPCDLAWLPFSQVRHSAASATVSSGSSTVPLYFWKLSARCWFERVKRPLRSAPHAVLSRSRIHALDAAAATVLPFASASVGRAPWARSMAISRRCSSLAASDPAPLRPVV